MRHSEYHILVPARLLLGVLISFTCVVIVITLLMAA
jgi:hypothetical protein